jgi:hypothetical protein
VINENVSATDNVSATMSMKSGVNENVKIHGYYSVQHIRNGKVIHEEKFANLVTDAGKNHLLDTFFRGAGYSENFALGLKGTGAPAAGDTMASHATWSEVGGSNAPVYTGTRKDVTLGAAAGAQSVSAAQAFVFTSAGTVAGCFMVSQGSTTKDNTTGTLYSAGNFAASRNVEIGDTLNVTYTAGV